MEKYLSTYKHGVAVLNLPGRQRKNTMWVQSVEKKDVVHTYIVPLHLSKYSTMYTGSIFYTWHSISEYLKHLPIA